MLEGTPRPEPGPPPAIPVLEADHAGSIAQERGGCGAVAPQWGDRRPFGAARSCFPGGRDLNGPLAGVLPPGGAGQGAAGPVPSRQRGDRHSRGSLQRPGLPGLGAAGRRPSVLRGLPGRQRGVLRLMRPAGRTRGRPDEGPPVHAPGAGRGRGWSGCPSGPAVIPRASRQCCPGNARLPCHEPAVERGRTHSFGRQTRSCHPLVIDQIAYDEDSFMTARSPPPRVGRGPGSCWHHPEREGLPSCAVMTDHAAPGGRVPGKDRSVAGQRDCNRAWPVRRVAASPSLLPGCLCIPVCTRTFGDPLGSGRPGIDQHRRGGGGQVLPCLSVPEPGGHAGSDRPCGPDLAGHGPCHDHLARRGRRDGRRADGADAVMVERCGGPEGCHPSPSSTRTSISDPRVLQEAVSVHRARVPGRGPAAGESGRGRSGRGRGTLAAAPVGCRPPPWPTRSLPPAPRPSPCPGDRGRPRAAPRDVVRHPAISLRPIAGRRARTGLAQACFWLQATDAPASPGRPRRVSVAAPHPRRGSTLQGIQGVWGHDLVPGRTRASVQWTGPGSQARARTSRVTEWGPRGRSGRTRAGQGSGCGPSSGRSVGC